MKIFVKNEIIVSNKQFDKLMLNVYNAEKQDTGIYIVDLPDIVSINKMLRDIGKNIKITSLYPLCLPVDDTLMIVIRRKDY